jgi:hypothetical protein
MPPYGKEGGSTSKSYTPNLYGVTTFSSATRNLQQILVFKYRRGRATYIPGRVFAELPICSIDQLWLRPDTRCPIFSIDFWE